jgi:hypothetical protein
MSGVFHSLLKIVPAVQLAAPYAPLPMLNGELIGKYRG